jgi:hypothetical protein
MAYLEKVINGAPQTASELAELAGRHRDKSKVFAGQTAEYLLNRYGAGIPTSTWVRQFPKESRAFVGSTADALINVPNRGSIASTPSQAHMIPPNFKPKTILTNAYSV